MKSPGKSILKGSLFLVLMAAVAFGYALLAFLLRGEVVIEMRTGEEEDFQIPEPQRLVLVDTNTGLGSSPGKITADGSVRLFGPDGELCELDADGYGAMSYRYGEYDLKEAGKYRFELDKLEGAQSRGALMTRDKLPGLGTAVWCGLACGLLAIPCAVLGGLALLFSPKNQSVAQS